MGLPPQFENGIVASGTFWPANAGRPFDPFWNLRQRKTRQTIDLGRKQMALEIRPATFPSKIAAFAAW
jgi:hypothetical protein